MDTLDLMALWAITALGFVAATLRIYLAIRQGGPMSPGWTVQSFVFPGLLLLGLLMYYAGIDVILPVMVIALAEELICGFLRRRQEKDSKS